MRYSLLLLSLLFSHFALAEAPVHHHLEVTLKPKSSTLQVVDTITLDEDVAAEFLLHQGLDPRLEGAGTLQRVGTVEGAVPLEHYRVTGAGHRFTLRYGGEIRHALKAWGGKRGKVDRATPAEIGEQGVYLSGSGGWYPLFGDRLHSFELSVRLPRGWRSVSQGEEPTPDHWIERQPQDDLYLLAYPYQLHRDAGSHGEARVYLRRDDPRLARRYLDATLEYLALYSELIGPYPYTKFALVENRWESGYGMPSFTLLGPRVLRMPFILKSSYPHEVLHNWWGNGVYIDYTAGNWAEGLTAYLADHLIKERDGRGEQYRRDLLFKYAEYVNGGEERPLSEFRSRHGEASQAIGYGKSAMLFHMLRGELGDERFIEGLRAFYRDFRFQRASFGDLQGAFETVSKRDLSPFFTQWLTRSGAPSLSIVETSHEGTALRLKLRQEQEGSPYRLEIPLTLRLKGYDAPHRTQVTMTEREQTWSLALPAPPLRLEVDPGFDLFRRLHAKERPPSLAQLFGAEQLLLVYPERPKSLSDGYRRLAETWAAGDPSVEVASDAELSRLPETQAVWLLGWENRFLQRIQRRLGERATLDEEGVVIDGERLARATTSVVLSTPRIAWLGAHAVEALSGLTRKLPHYGKYSYLAFNGEAPTNRLKGQWPVIDSPLVKVLGAGGEAPIALEKRSALGR